LNVENAHLNAVKKVNGPDTSPLGSTIWKQMETKWKQEKTPKSSAAYIVRNRMLLAPVYGSMVSGVKIYAATNWQPIHRISHRVCCRI